MLDATVTIGEGADARTIRGVVWLGIELDRRQYALGLIRMEVLASGAGGPLALGAPLTIGDWFAGHIMDLSFKAPTIRIMAEGAITTQPIDAPSVEDE
jgi:hypothetical protein